MKTEVKTITPALAAKMLERNVSNRPLRPSTVEGLAEAIRRGEWILSHQGISFGKSGNLLDGQHRLSAIIESGMAVQMNVTTEEDDRAYQVTDIGIKRSNADVLHCPQGLAAVARFLGVVEEKTKRNGITPQYLIPFIKAVEPQYTALTDFCPSLSKTWSTAAVRSAAIIRLLDGADESHVLMTYHALVHLEYDAMVPIAHALVRQRERGTIPSANMEMFIRCLKVFNPAEASMRTIQISQPGTLLDYARRVIAEQIRGQKKARADTVGRKKSVVKPEFITR